MTATLFAANAQVDTAISHVGQDIPGGAGQQPEHRCDGDGVRHNCRARTRRGGGGTVARESDPASPPAVVQENIHLLAQLGFMPN